MSARAPLSERERRTISEVAAHYPEARAAAVEALKAVQAERGWVSDEALVAVAELLELSPADLENLATFYNLIFRRPVGEHVILLCDSVSCWVVGYEAVRDALSRQLGISFGETTADGRFTLLPVPCLGACDRAPALMIDNDLYGPVTPGDIPELLGRYATPEETP
jgi:NADH-quinone oxidoreductase subunit E